MIGRIRGSITAKLLVISVGLSIVPLIAVCFFILSHFYGDYYEEAVKNSGYLLTSTSDILDEKIRSLSMASSLAITDKSVRSLMEMDRKYRSGADLLTQGYTVSERIVAAREFFYTLEILNPDICGSTLITSREVYGNYPGGQTYDPAFDSSYREYEWFRRSLSLHGAILITDRHVPYQIKAADFEVVSVCRSIFDAIRGDYLGTILIDMNASHLREALSDADDGSFMILLDEQNRVVASGADEPSLVGRLLSHDFGGSRSGYFNLRGDDGTAYLFNYVRSDYTGWRLGHLIPEAAVRSGSLRATLLIVQGMSVIILLMIVGVAVMITSVSNPIMRLNKRIERIGTGDLSDYPDEFARRRDEIGQLSKSIRRMKDNLVELIEKLTAAISGQKEAQLMALQSQINPHFILNTLNSIQMMAKIAGADNVVFMLENLGSLFKTYIRTDKTMVSVREEERSILTYIRLQRMRHGEKLRYECLLPEEIMDFRCLKFLIQPVVENAILHGMELKRSATLIVFGGCLLDGSHLLLYVEDDGAGIPEERLRELRGKLSLTAAEGMSERGIGLANVHNRLRLHYGEDYGLSVTSALGRGTRVELVIPVIRGE